MEITWLGGACFRLRGRDAAVATDPHTARIAKRSARPKADLVTVSTPANGSVTAAVRPHHRERQPFIVDGPGEYEVAGVYVNGLVERAGDAATVFGIGIDRLNVAHITRDVGDIGDAVVGALGAIDVLLIDVAWQPDAPAHMVSLVTRIEPRIVVPYDATDGSRVAGESVSARTARELGATDVTSADSLTINRSSLPEPIAVQLLEARCG